jgi:hypothetical protein
MLRNFRCCVGRAAVTLALLVWTTAFLHAQSVPGTDAKLQTLPGNPPPQARSLIDRGRAPDTLPMDHILLMLRRSAPREQALNTFVSQQYDPHSANFHHWLTPEQFDQQFGPSSSDVEKVSQWLTQQGFTINRVPAGGLFVDFSGNAGQVAHAFHTEIHRYRIGEEEHYANAADPAIPADLASIISGFRALNDLHPQSQVHHLGVAHYDRSTGTWARANAQHPLLTNPPGTTFPLYIAGPQDFATIYGVDQVWRQHATADPSSPLLVGTGQTIAVVGETNLQSADIQNFRDQFGLTALGPNGSVQMENPPASVCAAPNPSANEPESYLDAEWAGATAPDATIDFVACGRQGVTSGADLAAAYIIADPVHVQKISVLSTSYGGCEAQPQSEANQFYVSLWQQAAVEGITVVVASGDAGGDGCGGVYTASTNGLSVVNEASTPWNIAAGGTDFSDVFSGTAATYWSPTNGANLQSARSYIPEMAWNDTCASPLVLAKFGPTFSSAVGPNGYCTYASQQPIDQNTGFPPYFFAFAGGGGLSTVSPRPVWQTGVAGLPAQGGRAVPDISMFSAGGDTWSQTLILCDSALVNMPAGSGCDFTNANDVFAGYGGGTSFVAPAFAGIMALIDQKSGDRQGQANYVLYPLAAAQYVSNSDPTQPSLATCAAYIGTQVSSGCYFHDISATPNPVASATQPFLTGNTAIPCTGTASVPGTFTDSSTDSNSNSRNCYGYEITVAQNGASLTTTPNYYGELATADNAASPAFAAGPGYDLATGLGSPNVVALVNAPQWSALAITTTTLAQGRVATAYAQTLTATGRLTPYTWSVTSGSLPSGLTLAPATGAITGTPTAVGTSTFTVQVTDPENPPATATATLSLVVVAALTPTTTVLTASALSVAPGGSATLTATVTGAGGVPTGTVTFINGSTAIGSATLNNGIATFTTSFPAAGTAVLQADYLGDATFAPSQSAQLAVTIATPGFTATVNPTSLTVPFGNSGVATVSLIPQGGFTGPVSLACGTLPVYFSCSFAAKSISFAPDGATVTDNLTVYAATVPTAASLAFWLPAGLGLLAGLRRRRSTASAQKLWLFCLLGCASMAIMAMTACGRGDHQAPLGTYTVPIVLQAQGVPNQTVNLTVIVN